MASAKEKVLLFECNAKSSVLLKTGKSKANRENAILAFQASHT